VEIAHGVAAAICHVDLFGSPQGLKPSVLQSQIGTAEAVPFPKTVDESTARLEATPFKAIQMAGRCEFFDARSFASAGEPR